MSFKILIESTYETEEGLFFKGRMIREGWGNDTFYSYRQLKKTVSPIDKWAGLPITIEHRGLSINSSVNKVGEILKAYALDSLKDILCEGKLTHKTAIEAYKNGKNYLSIGSSFWRFLLSAFSIEPNHLSIVSTPAIKQAQILSKKNNFSEEKMSEEELRALAQEIKALQDKVDTLSDEEQGILKSFIDEIYKEPTAEPEAGELDDEGTDAEKNAKIAELEARIAELEAQNKKTEGELSAKKKTVDILSKNISKAKASGALSSSDRSLSMNFRR